MLTELRRHALHTAPCEGATACHERGTKDWEGATARTPSSPWDTCVAEKRARAGHFRGARKRSGMHTAAALAIALEEPAARVAAALRLAANAFEVIGAGGQAALALHAPQRPLALTHRATRPPEEAGIDTAANSVQHIELIPCNFRSHGFTAFRR